jgi:hypothetical protein
VQSWKKKSTKPQTVPERVAQATAADAEAAPIVVVDPKVWTCETTLLQYSLIPKTGDGDSAYNSDEMFPREVDSFTVLPFKLQFKRTS